MSRALVAVLAVLLLVAPAAAADVPLLDDVRAADVALAGREVLVAREHRHGRVTVDALDPVGGAPPRRVLTVPSPGRDWVASVAVTASPLRVAVLVGFDDDEGNTREWRVYSGPPAGPVTLLRRVRRPPAPVWVPMSADVDGDRLLLTEFRLSDFRARAQILAPGAAPATFPPLAPPLLGRADRGAGGRPVRHPASRRHRARRAVDSARRRVDDAGAARRRGARRRVDRQRLCALCAAGRHGAGRAARCVPERRGAARRA